MAARAALAVALISLTAAAVTASPERWRREGWTTDFSRHAAPLEEIRSGGPPKDGIPAIDAPQFQPVAAEREIADIEPVVGLEIDGDARAYPLRILIWHEIVNDVVGGVPVAVTYCPLCNAAVVFDSRLGDRVLTFGTTGKLRHSDLVMYDRQTESWWQQFTGEAIVGTLTGEKLAPLPSRLESFALFKERHPSGRVLVPGHPRLRPYGRNPYVRYDSSKRPFLFTGALPEDIDAMARVVVVRPGEEPVAVTLQLLRQRRRLEAGDLTLSWQEGQASALDAGTVSAGRDVGNVVVRRRDGSAGWQDVPYDVTFAFVYYAFHPDKAIIQRCPDAGGGDGVTPIRCPPPVGQ